MQEIKMRVWDGKEYRYPPPIGEWDFEDCELFAGYNQKAKARELFTGLKDKNGREIYEGDIIRAWIDFGPGGEGLREYVVTLTEWGHNIQQWPYQEKGFYPPEVIGNTHENPEILGRNTGPSAK